MVKKRFIGIFMSAIILFTLSATTAFAAEPSTEAVAYNMEITSNGIVSITDENGNAAPASVYSTISGYEQKTLTGDPAGVIVYVSASGIGGMGVTIETSSSWNGYMSLDILGSDGSTPASGISVYSNTTKYLNNLMHYSPAYFLFSFRGIPSGQSVFAKIWVYG